MPIWFAPETKAERLARIAADQAKRERQERRRREAWERMKAAFAAARS